MIDIPRRCQPVHLLAMLVIAAAATLLPAGDALAHDLLARAPKEYRAPNTCAGIEPTAPFVAPPEGYQRKYDTIAHRFLDNERDVGDVAPAMYAIVDALIDEAVATLKPLPAEAPGDAEFASAALRGIDCILLRHGFVYPGRGLVQLLSDGLAPTMYDDAAELDKLRQEEHNRRRAAFIASRGQGPFYVVDCDTASFLYLAIAEIMHYPLRFVDIPTHNFVRWDIDQTSYIDFETMDGIVTDDAYYETNWGIPVSFVGRGGILQSMTAPSILSYHDCLVAIAWSWRSDYGRMVDLYQSAVARTPEAQFPLNNLAWYYAAVPQLDLRDGAKAVEYAERAAAIQADGDTLDTLACAYAQRHGPGDLDVAVRKEEEAAAVGYAPFNSDFAAHTALFERGKACTDPTFGTDTTPFRPGHTTSQTASDKDLLRMR
jgi:hypothetical protein